MSSPLVLGNDVRIIPPSTKKLVTNPYLLRMNQDPLGLQAYVVARDGEAYVLVKDADTLFGKSRYVALYNANESEHEFTVKSSDLDLGGKIAAFDLVERADIGEFENEVSIKVRPHAAKFFRFDADLRLDRTIYEAETAYLSDYSEIDDSSYGATNSCVVQGRAYYAPVQGASGGMAVVNLGARETNDLIWKSVNVSDSGKYRLTFRHNTPEPRKFYVQIDGGDKQMLWVGKGTTGFCDISLDAELKKGTHSVRLTNAYGKTPDIDFMRVEKR
jgi:hypothetical protein